MCPVFVHACVRACVRVCVRVCVCVCGGGGGTKERKQFEISCCGIVCTGGDPRKYKRKSLQTIVMIRVIVGEIVDQRQNPAQGQELGTN